MGICSATIPFSGLKGYVVPVGFKEFSEHLLESTCDPKYMVKIS